MRVGIMRSIEQLTEEILSLPSELRALLSERLVESLKFDTEPVSQALWITEAKRRRDEVRHGSIQPVGKETFLVSQQRF